MRKIAVIGLSDTTHHRAPWFCDDWEKWVLGWDTGAEDADVYFDPHIEFDPPGGFSGFGPGAYRDYLRRLTKPIYMDRVYNDIPQSRPYPFEAVQAALGLPNGRLIYAESTIGYMLAMALHEVLSKRDVGRVGVWGVDMATGSEYSNQRPNAEYLIGRLNGAGIPVFIPQESALLKSVYAGGRYGFEAAA